MCTRRGVEVERGHLGRRGAALIDDEGLTAHFLTSGAPTRWTRGETILRARRRRGCRAHSVPWAARLGAKVIGVIGSEAKASSPKKNG